MQSNPHGIPLSPTDEQPWHSRNFWTKIKWYQHISTQTFTLFVGFKKKWKLDKMERWSLDTEIKSRVKEDVRRNFPWTWKKEGDGVVKADRTAQNRIMPQMSWEPFWSSFIKSTRIISRISSKHYGQLTFCKYNGAVSL